ncbi:transposable element Tc1 transposase [Trichonephila clavipes]|nr:transposable element Tc1 transposase [Trichonephila clavipes]
MANNQSVRRHLEAFTRGRIFGKLEESRSVTSVAAEFGIAHSIVSRLWRQFQTTGAAIRGFSSGRPRGTTPADDRYTLSYRPEETGGRKREKLLDTRHRRRSLWCRKHRNWRDNEWGRVLFTDESRFSLSSYSHRILIWRERGSRNHLSNINERNRRLAARTLPQVTIRELRLALQDEWAAMPQQLIGTLTLSMGRRCENCLAVSGDHIPY